MNLSLITDTFYIYHKINVNINILNNTCIHDCIHYMYM